MPKQGDQFIVELTETHIGGELIGIQILDLR